VREENAACAQEIIDEQIRESRQEVRSLAEGDEPTALDAASDDDDVPRASGVRFSWLREGLLFLGLACIVYKEKGDELKAKEDVAQPVSSGTSQSSIGLKDKGYAARFLHQ
jgi:hypothetical protein